MSVEDDLKRKYLQVLRLVEGESVADGIARLRMLRRLVLVNGLPMDASDMGSFGKGSMRGIIWKALLGVKFIDVDAYVRLVEKGPSVDYEKIANDVYRTFSQHREYTSRVPRERLVRLLNAYVHQRGNVRETYMQTMSVLLAPFVFLMPEPEAFAAFERLLRERIPDYVFKYAGVHRGCDLLNRCLEIVDPELFHRLEAHNLKPQMYAFANISSLGMCVLPLSESMRLLDIQLAYGTYLGVFFSLARLELARQRILDVEHRKPIITRDMELGLGYGSKDVLTCTMALLDDIDDDLYQEVAQHTGERTHNTSVPRSTSAGMRNYLMHAAHSYLEQAELAAEDYGEAGGILMHLANSCLEQTEPAAEDYGEASSKRSR